MLRGRPDRGYHELNLCFGSLIAIAQILSEHAKCSTTRRLISSLPSSWSTSLMTERLLNLLAINLKNSSILSNLSETLAKDSKTQAKALTTNAAGATTGAAYM